MEEYAEAVVRLRARMGQLNIIPLIQHRGHHLLPQPLQHMRRAPGRQLRLQLPAHRAAGGPGGELPPGDHRVQIEAGAPRQDGEPVPGQDVLDAAVRGLREPGGGPVLAGVGHGDHMMGDGGHLLRRRGGGADGHSLVNLHGVDADDLAVITFRQLDAEPGFAAGGGAYDAEDSGRHGGSFFSPRIPRGRCIGGICCFGTQDGGDRTDWGAAAICLLTKIPPYPIITIRGGTSPSFRPPIFRFFIVMQKPPPARAAVSVLPA